MLKASPTRLDDDPAQELLLGALRYGSVLGDNPDHDLGGACPDDQYLTLRRGSAYVVPERHSGSRVTLDGSPVWFTPNADFVRFCHLLAHASNQGLLLLLRLDGVHRVYDCNRLAADCDPASCDTEVGRLGKSNPLCGVFLAKSNLRRVRLQGRLASQTTSCTRRLTACNCSSDEQQQKRTRHLNHPIENDGI